MPNSIFLLVCILPFILISSLPSSDKFKVNLPLEFNLLGYKTHRHYPNDTFFKIAREVGNRIIIGTDAHESQSLLDMNTYHQARQHLENLGLSITEDITFLR